MNHSAQVAEARAEKDRVTLVSKNALNGGRGRGQD
jgi:hypothetical protein